MLIRHHRLAADVFRLLQLVEKVIRIWRDVEIRATVVFNSIIINSVSAKVMIVIREKIHREEKTLKLSTCVPMLRFVSRYYI